MVPDRQKVWTDGQMDGHTDDAKTISLRLRRGITTYDMDTTQSIAVANIPYRWFHLNDCSCQQPMVSLSLLQLPSTYDTTQWIADANSLWFHSFDYSCQQPMIPLN